MKLKRIVLFQIRIVYKSGYTHDFEAASFKVKNGNYEWEICGDINKPIIIGIDEIAAVWQLSHRRKWIIE